MKQILVTGGAGLIGSNLVRHLNGLGETEITIVDNLGKGDKWKNLRGLRYKFYLEKEELFDFLEENNTFTHVFHLGACSSTTENDASYLVQNNYHYSVNLFHYSNEMGARFAYASSAATYGNGDLGYSEKIPVSNLRPLNAYGYSKQMFDEYLLQNNFLDRCLGLKYFNVFGMGEGHKGDMRSLVLKGYKQIKETGKLQLFQSHKPEYNHGEQKRDFLYVKDAVSMTIGLAFANCSGIFNIGSGIAETWNELARALFKAMNKEPQIDYVPMPESIQSKYQYYTCASMEKWQKTGLPGPKYDLASSINEYVKALNEDNL